MTEHPMTAASVFAVDVAAKVGALPVIARGIVIDAYLRAWIKVGLCVCGRGFVESVISEALRQESSPVPIVDANLERVPRLEELV
jgi:hypothetical protein